MVLQETAAEKDIGVGICHSEANTAQAVPVPTYLLGQLTRAFHYRDRQVFIRLYNKQYVRPHLVVWHGMVPLVQRGQKTGLICSRLYWFVRRMTKANLYQCFGS